METALYLIPVTLGDTPIDKVLPSYNTDIIRGIKHFIVEDVRSARRFLKKVDKDIVIDELTFCPMGKHASAELFASYLRPLEQGLRWVSLGSRVVRPWPILVPMWCLSHSERDCGLFLWWGLLP